MNVLTIQPILVNPVDTDDDGIPDIEDECPNDSTNTCNVDTDDDGIPDIEDECPNDSTNTCNVDTDDDGIPDIEDN